jgi:hypothetical protein
MGADEEKLREKAFAFLHREDSHRISHALEDLPKDAQAQAMEIASLPAGTSLLRRMFAPVTHDASPAPGAFPG